MTAPVKIANAQWLRAFLSLFFVGQDDVKYRVLVDGWEDSRPHNAAVPWVGVEVHCRGWSKRFRIPLSMIDGEDVKAIINEFTAQSEGALLVSATELQVIQEMVH